MLPKTYAQQRELKIGSRLIPFAFFVFGKLKVYRLAVENVTTRLLKMASLLAKKDPRPNTRHKCRCEFARPNYLLPCTDCRVFFEGE